MFEQLPSLAELQEAETAITESRHIDELERRARLIEKGARAEVLLNSPVFTEAAESYFHDLLLELVMTKSDENLRRQEIYFEIRALRGIDATLKAWVSTAEELVALTKAEDEDDDIEGQDEELDG